MADSELAALTEETTPPGSYWVYMVDSAGTIDRKVSLTNAVAAVGVALTGAQTVAGVKTFSSDPIIPDEVYGAGWNGVLEPPTKNAVYDKVESLSGTYLSLADTTERVQDEIGALLAPDTGDLDWTYDDAGNAESVVIKTSVLSTFIRALLDDADAAVARATLGIHGISDIVTNAPPWTHSTTASYAANTGRWGRCWGGAATITKLGLRVGTASGNISVGVYANSGTGRNALAATRRATSGAVACPASGNAEVSLGASVAVKAGDDHYGFSVDNATATFIVTTTSFAGDLVKGFGAGNTAAHPLADPAPVTFATMQTPLIVGVE